ncbi:MAG: MFS transporter [Pseudomonadota bacterium]|nr:MFS transporter [Pseudomonadota bacterium]
MNSQVSRTYLAYVILLLFLVNAANYGQRMIIAIILPAIKTEIALTDAQLGILMGGAFALVFAVAGVPLARIADRTVRRTFLAGAILFWSSATALFGATHTFAQMLAARVALGVGESACIPTSHSLLTDYVSPNNRPLAFGIHSTGGVVGVTIALMLGGYLATAVGWRSTMYLAAIPGFLLALLLFFTLREPARQGASASEPEVRHFPLKAVVQHLLSTKSYIFVLLAICFSLLVEFGLNQWLPSFYVRQFGLEMADVGYSYGLAIASGGIPGSIIGGLVANRLVRSDIRWLAWLPATMYAIALPVGLSMLLATTAQQALMLNALYAFVIFATNGAFWAACFISIPPMMRATTSAITLMVGGIFGVAVGPVLVGLISDFLAPRAGSHSLQSSLVAVQCLAIVVVVFLLFAARYLRKDRL